MARTERMIDASPPAVFGVLADPRSYVYWVIGSRQIRAADPAWPGRGSRFHHTVNIGPLRIRDYTQVEEVERDRLLQLKAKARPFGTARITIRLQEEAGRTRVTMVEDAADPLSAFVFQPLTHLALRHRNARSLERLGELAEGRRAMPGEEPKAKSRWPGDDGPVINPTLHGRRGARGRAAAALGRGAAPIAGRRVLITGGSSGIGMACARRLLHGGARVALLARDQDELEHSRVQLGHAPLALAADVADAQAMQRAVGEAAGQLGGLDAVIANAGAAVYGPFREAGAADYERTVRTNLLGVLATAHAALPHLERTRGTLIVTGSIAGRVPTPWLAAYAASKHGVRGFVRSLHAELHALKSPVQVALVAPGPVDTPFWRRARTTDRRLPPRIVGAYRPEDVAREVERALVRPRPERAVGGLMAAWALCDAIAPRASLAVTGRVARLGWRRRERHAPSPDDGLDSPGGPSGHAGGLRSRPSLLGAVRDRRDA